MANVLIIAPYLIINLTKANVLNVILFAKNALNLMILAQAVELESIFKTF